jgi:hypothetical protein
MTTTPPTAKHRRDRRHQAPAGKDYHMLFATTAPALLFLALTLGLTALSMMEDSPHQHLSVPAVSAGGDN